MARTMTETLANDLLPYVRGAFDVPEDWVHAVNDPDNGWAIEVALNMYATDAGDAESGPCVSLHVSRWIQVYEDEVGFVVALHDNDVDGDAYDPRPSRVVRLGNIATTLIWSKVCALVDNDPAFAIERDVKEGS